nr:MAG TPA: hypothetical protein [Caudoviricetes sp.]
MLLIRPKPIALVYWIKGKMCLKYSVSTRKNFMTSPLWAMFCRQS